MLGYPRSLASVRDLQSQNIHKIIEQAFCFKKSGFTHVREAVVLLAFFEPSTRTRTSFEMAAHRLGMKPVAFAADHSTSLKKGESLHETLANLLAMKPDLLVCRHGGDVRVAEILRTCEVAWVNAGDGQGEHPTQALLDAMTIIERLDQIEGQRIVYVGDVLHSRVARSGVLLFEMLGAEVAVAAPVEWVPKDGAWAKCKRFASLAEASEWATVCIGLRIQKERHADNKSVPVQDYRLDRRNLARLSSNALIMHPGPFVAGEDLDEEILSDPRCAIHDQVTNGVYVRAAIMAEMVGKA